MELDRCGKRVVVKENSMNYCENIKCNRINLCDYPCEPYTDYIINLSLMKNIPVGIENKLLSNCINCKSNIEDYFEYEVSDDMWNKIIDKEIPLIELFDQNAVYDYISSEYENFCKQEGICSECKMPLKEFIEMEDGIVSERYFACGNGC